MVNHLLLARPSPNSAANRWPRICHSGRLGMLVILILACADVFREPADLGAVHVGPGWSVVEDRCPSFVASLERTTSL